VGPCAVIREVARRSLKTKRARKQPVTTEQVDQVLRNLTGPAASLQDLILAAAIAIGFYGFARVDETLSILWQTMRFFDTHVEIFVIRSKTDQYCDGHWIIISVAPPGSAAVCPIAILRRLIRQGDYARHDAGEPSARLIRGVFKTRAGHVLCAKGFAYTTYLSKVKQAFADVGVDPASVGTHVLRISGATEAARADVPDRLRLLQGHWKSESMLRHYTREGLPAQARVSADMMQLLAGDRAAPEFE
jgi:hypothetical protein